MSRIIEACANEIEKIWENNLRPSAFSEFPGQTKIKEKLKIYIEASKKRGEALDHCLLSGPPGLGKTTLANIISQEMGVKIKTTSGPALDKKGDLAAILTSLEPKSILFIDEIHRLNKNVEEYLYSAMEDFSIDIVTGEGLGARSMKFQLAPFSLIGATTRAGLMDKPFMDRFGIVERLQFYNREDLNLIVKRSAKILNVGISDKASLELAGRCRGTPRIANRLLKRVRDFAEIKGNGNIDDKIMNFSLQQLEVDAKGLDEMDRTILRVIQEKFGGGPVGIETLSAAVGEDKGTLEEVYEPFLLQEGFIQKTPRGRTTTELSEEHLDL